MSRYFRDRVCTGGGSSNRTMGYGRNQNIQNGYSRPNECITESVTNPK